MLNVGTLGHYVISFLNLAAMHHLFETSAHIGARIAGLKGPDSTSDESCSAEDVSGSLMGWCRGLGGGTLNFVCYIG